MGGLFMTIAAIGGFISVSAFYIIPGVLLLIPGIMGLKKPIQQHKNFKWKMWVPVSIFIAALIFVTSMTSGESSAETASNENAEAETFQMGEEIDVEKLGYNVISVFSTDTVNNSFMSENATGTFLVFEVEVMNKDKEARTIDSSLFKLLLEDGTEFDPSSSATMTANENNEFFLTKVNPQLSARGYVVFDVPEIKEGYFLQLSGGMLSTTSKLVEVDKSLINNVAADNPVEAVEGEEPETEAPVEQESSDEGTQKEQQVVETETVQSIEENKAETAKDAILLVESLSPGDYTAFSDPSLDTVMVDGSYYFYIGYTSASGTGGDVFVEEELETCLLLHTVQKQIQMRLCLISLFH